ncbi:MAG TPA: CDP-diacylglycerol--glycerol-3-phosphate 3-phosphatidyltransferase [Candidatus Aminicenantes bacterium]|nr:CDP-diacylglycerol--glycerol-3-phosphate 3-phosphatidyltransferase [Candidatus Aminicenantes bacterium]
MTTANLITITRIVLVPIFLVILLTEMQNKEIIAFALFILASVSDALDGYFARRFNQITPLGKFLDPLADKLLVAAALLALVYHQYVETWVAAIIILREILITALRFYSLVQESVFSASWLAKKKTLMQIIGISVLIIHPKMPKPNFFFWAGTIILYFAVVLTVYSAFEYVLKYARPNQE